MSNRVVDILVTGGAGFIGSHLVDRLLREGHTVTAVDNFDRFYSPSIKEANVAAHLHHPQYRLVRADIRDRHSLSLQLRDPYDVLVHLAAKAGVRPSIENPFTYQQVNVGGTQNLLELARECGIKQFIFGSSSSVYGVNSSVPWREEDGALQPISPYAASKLAGELMGHVYSHLYAIRFIALRFFTVYGPRQRPDLAIHRFARSALERQPVPVFGDGTTSRDYTYVGDIVNGICSAMNYRGSQYEIFNLGSDAPVSLNDLLAAIEEVLGRPIIRNLQAVMPGDVPHTWADLEKARRLLNYRPSVPLKEGLKQFADWLVSQGTSAGLFPATHPV